MADRPQDFLTDLVRNGPIPNPSSPASAVLSAVRRQLEPHVTRVAGQRPGRRDCARKATGSAIKIKVVGKVKATNVHYLLVFPSANMSPVY